MTSKQDSVAGPTGLKPATDYFLAILLATVLAGFLSACTGLPKPEKPELPTVPGLEKPLKELPWINAYIARWYGNDQAACSITFDDGTLDQYLLAAPELEARGINGTFFIITGPRVEGVWKDGNRYRQLFSWDQARDLHARGHEIASHTASHIDLRANPHLAEAEIGRAYEVLRQELAEALPFSLGWPYWRSAPAANEQARKFHYAARAGGIQGSSGSPGLGGANGLALDDYMMIGSRAILSTDTITKLAPLFEEVYRNGGWLVPSFHGIDDGLVPSMALGWEALELATFRDLLDGLTSYGFWLAPFGEVARYAIQRDDVALEIRKDQTGLRIHFSCTLDPAIFNQTLTLVIELPLAYHLQSIIDEVGGTFVTFHADELDFTRRYLVELPPGSGVLLIQTNRESL